MAGPNLVDDAVDRDHLAGRQHSVECDHIVELQHRTISHRNPKLEGCRIVGSQYSPDHGTEVSGG